MPPSPPVRQLLDRLQSGLPLLPDTPDNLLEVAGILKSYGIVLSAYWRNLDFIAREQFLVQVPMFKYFNGEITLGKIWRHLWHDRINYEFAEYCMRAMMWHGGGTLDQYLNSPEFIAKSDQAIQAKFRRNPFMRLCHRLFPEFLREQVRQMAYYHALGVFWSVMSDIFLTLSDRYDQGEITSIGAVVDHIRTGIVEAVSKSIAYRVVIDQVPYEIVPDRPELNFLAGAGIPYVETVFFRSFPFRGTVSYNAQLPDIPRDLQQFQYGALYADPLPIGGAGIPPTLLMHDMSRFIPPYLREYYQKSNRGLDNVRVKICISFQKSMFCVTTAVIQALAPFPIHTQNPHEQEANYRYLRGWCDRLAQSRIMDFIN